MKFLQGLPAQLFQVTSGFEFPRSKFGHVQPGRRGTIMLKGCPQDALEIKFIWQNPTRRIVPPIIRTDVPRIGRRENFIPLVKWNTRGNEIAKFEACERTRWTECIRGSEGDYVRWKGGSSKGGRWMDRPTDPAWQETSSRGSRVCTHRERNTKWSGKHRQCFLLSFPFFFFPLPSNALPRDISSNSLLTGLSELCRVAYWTRQDCVPFAPFFRPSRKSRNVGRNGGKGGERIGGFYYLNISTNTHASASSRENGLARTLT